MMLDIFINDLPSHTVSNRPGEVSVFPKLTCPKPFFDSRELAEQFPRTYALYYPNHLAYRKLWGKRYQHVHMVDSYFHLHYFYPVFFAYFFYHRSRSLPYLSLFKYLLPVFWAPYQMVHCVVDRMTRPFQCHALFYTISAQGPMRIRET